MNAALVVVHSALFGLYIDCYLIHNESVEYRNKQSATPLSNDKTFGNSFLVRL
jgi:hypothetical protein